MSRTEPSWHQYRITKRTQDYVYLGHATTDSSIDDFDRSTPSLHSDNDRSETSETNRTRSCDSDSAPTRTVADLKQDLKKQQERIAALQAEREQATVKVQEDATRYKELEEKYAKQISLRKDDQKRVDEAWEYCEEAAQECAELRAQVTTLEEQSRSTDEQHKAELQAKDEEIEQLKEDCQCAIAALEDTHEMEAIANEYEQTKLASRKAVDYLRKVVGTTEGNRKAWKDEKEQMESKIELISADARDTPQRNEDEIERLTRAKSLLEQQIDLFIGARKANRQMPG
jgi:chromosome segregation ATPase